jgi:hypothetical protein
MTCEYTTPQMLMSVMTVGLGMFMFCLPSYIIINGFPSLKGGKDVAP